MGTVHKLPSENVAALYIMKLYHKKSSQVFSEGHHGFPSRLALLSQKPSLIQPDLQPAAFEGQEIDLLCLSHRYGAPAKYRILLLDAGAPV